MTITTSFLTNNMKDLDLDSIAERIKDFLNQNCQHLLAGEALNSPRSVGDALQVEICERAMPFALNDDRIEVRNNFSRRSMEDLAFSVNGKYYAIDVKTHNIFTDFNMPNLISAQRLADFYKTDDNNYFCIIIVSYKIENGELVYTDCHFKPIENFDWKCLTLGALGCGQIQIKNANNLLFSEMSRKAWMLNLCTRMDTFYNKEIGKIGKRKNWFSQIKDDWENKK